MRRFSMLRSAAPAARWLGCQRSPLLVTIPKADRKCNFPGRWAQQGGVMLLVCLFALLALVRPISAQEQQAEGPAQYFLTPATSTAIRLHTHTADIDLAYDGAALIAAVDALYRLQNNASEPVAVTLKLVSDPATAPPPPDNLV